MYTRHPRIIATLIMVSFLALGSIASAQTATESYCPNGPLPSVSGPFTFLNVQQCNLSYDPPVCNQYNSIYTATLETANTLAAALGASVVADTNPLGDPLHFSFSAPIYELLFPNGYQIPAGYIATLYSTGSNPASNPAMYKPILDSVCGTTGGTTGGTGGGTTGGTTGGTGTPGIITTPVTDSNTAQTVTTHNIYTTTQQVAQNAITQYYQALMPQSGGQTLSSGNATTTISRPIVVGLSSSTSTLYTAAQTTIVFPVSVSVTVSALNVRSAPNTSAPLSGSQVLVLGDQFIVTGEVVGESIAGNNLWWVSKYGNYVWSGGTTVVGNTNG